MTRRYPWRRRVVRSPAPRRSGAVQLIISQYEAMMLPQSFLIMNGDTIRVVLTATVQGTKPEDFRTITLPVTIQARLA